MTTTQNPAELANLLAAAAELVARHIVGVRNWTPLTRDSLTAEELAAGDLSPLEADHVLAQREFLLGSIDQTQFSLAPLPAITHLLSLDGDVMPVCADRLTADQLLIAQVVEAANAQLLINRVVGITARIAGLERLRLIASELDAIGGGA